MSLVRSQYGGVAKRLTLIGAAVCASSCALTEDADSKWHVVVGDQDCGGECARDIFGPDLAGTWAEDCKVQESKISFDQSSFPAEVLRGKVSCKMVTVSDFDAMERYYFVRSPADCISDAAESLVAKYHYDDVAERLIQTTSYGEALLMQCGEAR